MQKRKQQRPRQKKSKLGKRMYEVVRHNQHARNGGMEHGTNQPLQIYGFWFKI